MYAKDTRERGSFALVPQGTHLQVICVWELGTLVHEREAWTRYLRSARDRAVKIAYLEDRFSGAALTPNRKAAPAWSPRRTYGSSH